MQIDQTGNLSLSLEHLLGESIAVLGIKGSGKSNTAAVMAEEMLASGLPLALVDIAGEYWGLRERYPILVLGRGPTADLEIAPSHGSALAEFSLRQSVPLILDLGDFSTEERLVLLERFFEELWRVAGELRRPYAIFLEEAPSFPRRAHLPRSGV
ncbi:MAG: DUF87 domain-containing protein [Ardenticatenales bacterium]|nr:DUF87 domain-containing protein [Ardenticatenales bacterium]